MTYGGGNDLDGTIFAYNIETKKETLLHSFDYYDGEDPYGNLVVSSGNLYGMTEDGGSPGHGNIFMINIKTQELTGTLQLHRGMGEVLTAASSSREKIFTE